MRYKIDMGTPKTFSAKNNIDPGSVPPELSGLTHREEMLIARAFMSFMSFQSCKYLLEKDIVKYYAKGMC